MLFYALGCWARACISAKMLFRVARLFSHNRKGRYTIEREVLFFVVQLFQTTNRPFFWGFGKRRSTLLLTTITITNITIVISVSTIAHTSLRSKPSLRNQLIERTNERTAQSKKKTHTHSLSFKDIFFSSFFLAPSLPFTYIFQGVTSFDSFVCSNFSLASTAIILRTRKKGYYSPPAQTYTYTHTYDIENDRLPNPKCKRRQPCPSRSYFFLYFASRWCGSRIL